MNRLSWRDIDGSHRLMALIVATLGLVSFFVGEKISAGGGLGWDGVTYAGLVRNLYDTINAGQLTEYYAQRFLPAAIVGAALRLVHLPLTNGNIIRGFEVYNLALLLVACWIWRRLSDHFAFSLRARWLGFGALFLNYQCSKQAFFYPVLTDVTALVLGMLLLLCYIEKRPVWLLITALCGAFTWQVTGMCGAALLLLLNVRVPDDVANRWPATYARVARNGWLALLVASVAVFGLLSGAAHLMGADAARRWHVYGVQRLMTVGPSLVAASLALIVLAGSPEFVVKSIRGVRSTRWSLLVLSLAALLIPALVVRAIANPAIPNIWSAFDVLRLIVLPAWGKFLLPLVTLAVFWGPMVLLLTLHWSAFCIESRKLGPGFVAVVALGVPLGLATEPRYVTLSWPFYVIAGVLATERMTVTASFAFVYTLITVVSAQFWIRLNYAPWTGDDYTELLEFPKQLYFMHYGYWMAWWPYLIQLVLVGGCVFWLRHSVRPMNPAAAAPVIRR